MRFKKVFVELSDFCGLECDFCPSASRIQRRGEIGLENFYHILREVSPLTPLIALHVLGDPLALKSFPHYLEITKLFPKLRLEITTSGFYLTHTHLNTLSQYPQIFQINISLMSALAQTRISLDHYLKPIFTLLHLREHWSYQPFINLRLWNTTQKEEVLILPKQNQPFYEKLSEFFNTPLPFSKNPICPPSLQHFRLSAKVILHHAPLFAWPEVNSTHTQEQGSCYGLKAQIAILSNGAVVPCCFDSNGILKLGNILTHSLKDILDSQKAQRIQQGFAQNKLTEELCQKCHFRALQKL